LQLLFEDLMLVGAFEGEAARRLALACLEALYDPTQFARNSEVDAFLNKMYPWQRRLRVHRDAGFVKSCQTPVLILPDDVPAHPYAVALESAHLASNTQVSIHPRKANPEQIQLALRHVRAFLKANRPAAAAEQPLAAAAQ
jgi:hypothetical protein